VTVDNDKVFVGGTLVLLTVGGSTYRGAGRITSGQQSPSQAHRPSTYAYLKRLFLAANGEKKKPLPSCRLTPSTEQARAHYPLYFWVQKKMDLRFTPIITYLVCL